MESCKHFSHPHNLSFNKSLEAAQLTCTPCNLPCTANTPVYSCHECQFVIHDQCFNATRSLIHPSHPDHPLTLLPSPTYPSGSFICNSCNQTGTGLCFGCSICDFDLHVHCAYNNHLDPKQIQLKAHPNHPLNYVADPPNTIGTCSCDVCGTQCDDKSALYRCEVCDYDAHLECVDLLETVHREDHEHELSLLYLNPYEEFECDVCRGMIGQNNCMYLCSSGCDYGVHVKCVAEKAKSAVESQMEKLLASQMEFLKMQNKYQMQQMVFEAQNQFFRRYR